MMDLVIVFNMYKSSYFYKKKFKVFSVFGHRHCVISNGTKPMSIGTKIISKILNLFVQQLKFFVSAICVHIGEGSRGNRICIGQSQSC